MARGINKVILVGNVGADPESRQLPSGGTATNIRVATTESWKDKESGERQERTEWHSIAIFSKLAEIVAEYVKKGQQVYVEGRLQTRKWQDNEGNDRYTTEIVASELVMLGGKPDEAKQAAPVGVAASKQPTTAAKPATKAPAKKTPAKKTKTAPVEPEVDSDGAPNDDIPF